MTTSGAPSERGTVEMPQPVTVDGHPGSSWQGTVKGKLLQYGHQSDPSYTMLGGESFCTNIGIRTDDGDILSISVSNPYEHNSRREYVLTSLAMNEGVSPDQPLRALPLPAEVIANLEITFNEHVRIGGQQTLGRVTELVTFDRTQTAPTNPDGTWLWPQSSIRSDFLGALGRAQTTRVKSATASRVAAPVLTELGVDNVLTPPNSAETEASGKYWHAVIERESRITEQGLPPTPYKLQGKLVPDWYANVGVAVPPTLGPRFNDDYIAIDADWNKTSYVSRGSLFAFAAQVDEAAGTAYNPTASPGVAIPNVLCVYKNPSNLSEYAINYTMHSHRQWAPDTRGRHTPLHFSFLLPDQYCNDFLMGIDANPDILESILQHSAFSELIGDKRAIQRIRTDRVLVVLPPNYSAEEGKVMGVRQIVAASQSNFRFYNHPVGEQDPS